MLVIDIFDDLYTKFYKSTSNNYMCIKLTMIEAKLWLKRVNPQGL